MLAHIPKIAAVEVAMPATTHTQHAAIWPTPMPSGLFMPSWFGPCLRHVPRLTSAQFIIIYVANKTKEWLFFDRDDNVDNAQWFIKKSF